MRLIPTLVKSSRLLHGAVSYGILRSQGCDVGYPVYLDTRDFDVGESVTIGRHCRFRESIALDDHTLVGTGTTMYGEIMVGRRSQIHQRCRFRGRVTIGRYCAIAQDVDFQERGHDYSYAAVQYPLYIDLLGVEYPEASKGAITIGNDVWIGAGVYVLSGVSIGDGAVVGANSVVTRDVEPYSIVAGVPAEHVKYRFPADVREELLELEWWTWSEDEIRANEDLFGGPLFPE